MNTDVAGRVKNVQLPTSKPLLPLFEAIMNSIHAIEDAKEEDGQIQIEVIRDPTNLFAESDRSIAAITGFVVKDNGIGFDDQNFEAFSTSDTTYKAARGGKGIGRFMWLAAFDTVEVDSVFGTDSRMNRRTFRFSTQGPGIENLTSAKVAEKSKSTVVRLIGFKEKYQAPCPKRLDTIAAFIVEEFLEYFLSLGRPSITLHDGPKGNSIDLDDIFDEEMVPKIDRREIKIKAKPFQILHVRLHSTHISDHRLYLCAQARAVVQERLSGHIPNLARRLPDDKDREFVYAAYVNSPVLDSTVNSDRTGFNLPEDSELLTASITMNDIRDTVHSECKSYLAPYTAPVAEKKRARVQQFVETDGPMYRPILKRLEDRIEKIDPEASNDEIDRELYAGYHELQVKLRDEGQKLLESPAPTDSDFDQFEERFIEFFEQISEVNRADLARYVCHRKAIIEFLKKQLTIQEGGKYRREDRIHNIIFPRGKTSNDVFFEEHNLWLIDERLAFHVFLSSDQPIKRVPVLENKSKKEPDIIVFDKAFAFAETEDVPFSSITIIEFKKPQRNDYSENENPLVQVAKYIADIRAGKARTADGRPLPISSNLPFYCYIVCDPTPTLKVWADHFELQDTPDHMGFFGYKRAYNAYIELISYDKLVADAEKRNKAFFQKLGLPKNVT